MLLIAESNCFFFVNLQYPLNLCKLKIFSVLKSIAVGHGSKVLMVALVSPCEDDVLETICSLNFAKRARGIESNKELPEVCSSNFF